MVGQHASMVWVNKPDSIGSAAFTITPSQWLKAYGKPRDTWADIALTMVDSSAFFGTFAGQFRWGAYAVAGISQVVSEENGIEDFPAWKVAVYRKGMTGVTVAIKVGWGYADARWMLNFWS